MAAFVVEEDDPSAHDVRRLLERHLAFARQHSPPVDAHALDADGLRADDVTFFSVRVDGLLLGVGALRQLDGEQGEIKSMHTAEAARGRGVGRAMVDHLVAVARSRGCRRLSLETGSMAAFAPARALYESVGFVRCEPFAGYRESPNSVYLTLELVELRPARLEDADAVAEIWRRGWQDGHVGAVPDELVAARDAGSFRRRAPERVGDTTVAVVDGQVAGFVMVVGDEVEQVYAASDHRGSGVATALLREAERQVAAGGHPTAWLAVVAGNPRARRFYERSGWVDEGLFDHHAEGEDGPITVPAHRYVKRVGLPPGDEHLQPQRR